MVDQFSVGDVAHFYSVANSWPTAVTFGSGRVLERRRFGAAEGLLWARGVSKAHLCDRKGSVHRRSMR